MSASAPKPAFAAGMLRALGRIERCTSSTGSTGSSQSHTTGAAPRLEWHVMPARRVSRPSLVELAIIVPKPRRHLETPLLPCCAGRGSRGLRVSSRRRSTRTSSIILSPPRRGGKTGSRAACCCQADAGRRHSWRCVVQKTAVNQHRSTTAVKWTSATYVWYATCHVAANGSLMELSRHTEL